MIHEIQSSSTSTTRHTTSYLQCGTTNIAAPAMVFIHGWPELGWSWRHQLPFFAEAGFRTYAPDMRGYGHSSTYNSHDAYAQQEVVADMLEFLDHIEADRAILVGHDWGSPTVWSLGRHHPERCLGLANLCVPYNTLENGWAGMLPHIDRALYPEDQFPAGQWEYQCFYEENFAAATAHFDSDPYLVAQLLFRKGNPDSAGQPAGTALTRIQGGFFGAGPMPDLPPDPDVVTEQDLQKFGESLSRNTFFGPDSYYMNHNLNAAYAQTTPDPTLDLPVLFLHARYDYTCETITSTLAEPMRAACRNLTERIVDSGHWMAQEKPNEVNQHLQNWLNQHF
ncbi:MAG: alpha/beta hydrolase [Pseudomonadota bacterium]